MSFAQTHVFKIMQRFLENFTFLVLLESEILKPLFILQREFHKNK